MYSPGSSPTQTVALHSKIQKVQLPVVDSTRHVIDLQRSSKLAIRLGAINIAVAILFYFEATQFLLFYALSISNNWLKYVDLSLALVFTSNALFHLFRYVQPQLSNNKVVLTDKQKDILGIGKAHDKLFVSPSKTYQAKPQLTPKSRSPTSYPIRRALPRKSPTSSSPNVQHNSSASSPYTPGRVQTSPTTTRRLSSGHNLSGVSSLSFAASPTSSPGVFTNGGRVQTPTKTPSPSRRSLGTDEDLMYDSNKFELYMKSEEEKYQMLKRAAQQDHSTKSLSASLWSYGRAAYEYIPTFGTYQLATRSETPSSKDDDDEAPQNPLKYDELWKKIGVRRDDVQQWGESFRMWLSQTVLEQLVKEINNINSKLVQMGCSENQIGLVNITSLQNIAATKNQHVPSLISVIPYLDVTTNQEYLVHRLKELAKGGCLRLYKWDSGGLYKGKAWDQDLPTDGQIIIHLFCTYMDTHLPSNPRYPEGKSFSGLHFLKAPTKPSEKKSDLVVYQVRTHKPHFRVIVETDVFDIPQGRNNLFHALCVFLHFVKLKHHGMLERVNLGVSGINVLWILNPKRPFDSHVHGLSP